MKKLLHKTYCSGLKSFQFKNCTVAISVLLQWRKNCYNRYTCFNGFRTIVMTLAIDLLPHDQMKRMLNHCNRSIPTILLYIATILFVLCRLYYCSKWLEDDV